MKVTEYNQIRNAPSVRKKPLAGAGSSFLDVLSSVEAGSSQTADVASVANTSGVDGLLALQEVSEETTARRQVVQQGHGMLDSLEALRHSLLMGAVPLSVLQTLESRLNQQRLLTSDPRLHEIIDDIELRVAVELAKLGR